MYCTYQDYSVLHVCFPYAAVVQKMGEVPCVPIPYNVGKKLGIREP